MDRFVQLFLKVVDQQMSSIYWSLPTKTQVEHLTKFSNLGFGCCCLGPSHWIHD